jgi:hypothetical protein
MKYVESESKKRQENNSASVKWRQAASSAGGQRGWQRKISRWRQAWRENDSVK